MVFAPGKGRGFTTGDGHPGAYLCESRERISAQLFPSSATEPVTMGVGGDRYEPRLGRVRGSAIWPGLESTFERVVNCVFGIGQSTCQPERLRENTWVELPQNVGVHGRAHGFHRQVTGRTSTRC